MTVTWLGQGSLLFETADAKILVDPYFSNSVEKVNPKNYRRTPINDACFDLSPDMMIFTHDHLDHFDPETASRFLAKNEKSMTVLSPTSVWGKARQYGGIHNYVAFDAGTEWTEYGIRVKAIQAIHSDAFAIGVLIEDLADGKKYYVTGDTLYNPKVFAELDTDIFAVFLPINGVGNNMNATDAARFAAKTGAKYAVPIHFGMFDEIDPHIFDAKNRTIPKAYQEIVFEEG